MNSISKRTAILVLAAFPFFASAETVERVVAIVNNEPILNSDIKALKVRAKNPEFLYPFLLPPDPSVLMKGDRKAMLDYLVGEKILQSEIKRLNLEVTMEKVESEIRAVAKRNNISIDELYAQVQREGLTKEKYQAAMKDNIERQSLLEQEIVSKIRVTDDDALAEYMSSHPDSKISVNEFTVSHIFFDPKKGGAEAALKRAEEVLVKLRQGDSFETLSEQFSEDPSYTTGGLLGTFKSGEFLPEVETAIAPLTPGQTSGVVRSRKGFHIVKLLSKKMAQDSRFEKEKERIKSHLLEKVVQRQFRIWLRGKKDDAYLRINEK